MSWSELRQNEEKRQLLQKARELLDTLHLEEPFHPFKHMAGLYLLFSFVEIKRWKLVSLQAVHLLEPLKEDHFGLYAMTALELASL